MPEGSCATRGTRERQCHQYRGCMSMSLPEARPFRRQRWRGQIRVVLYRRVPAISRHALCIDGREVRSPVPVPDLEG